MKAAALHGQQRAVQLSSSSVNHSMTWRQQFVEKDKSRNGLAADFKFFDRVVQWVKKGCHYHKKQARWAVATRRKHRKWLEEELVALQRLKLKFDKAITLQGRIIKHADAWLVFTKDSRVPPTNNLAERTLRPLVIMRKICFGNRSRDGGQRMAAIMSVKDTARRHGHNPLHLFYRLFTQPPDKVMRFLYKKTSAKKSSA